MIPSRLSLACFVVLSSALCGAEDREVVVAPLTPAHHAGQVYIAANSVAGLLDVDFRVDEKKGVVEFLNEGHTVRLVTGKLAAKIDGRTVKVPFEPYRVSDQIFVPLQFVASGLHQPVRFDPQTASVLIRLPNTHRLRALPLPTSKTGIVLFTPLPNEVQTKEVRVHGQANTQGEDLVIQFVSSDNVVLMQSRLPRSTGHFSEVLALIADAGSSQAITPRKIIAFSQSGQDGPKHNTVIIPITFRRTP